MPKIDWSQIKPIPGFDSLKWKREVHARIHEETKGMTDKEIRAYFRRNVEKDERWQAVYAKADAIAAGN